MAANFKILTNKTGKIINLRLSGDFDGSSASELVDFISSNFHKGQNVVINTDHIKSIHPFGRHALESKLHILYHKGPNLEFSGQNADQIAG